jgi:hypothetical protein
LNLAFYQGHADRKIRIKLEIDVNPPRGSRYEYDYLDFPLDFEVCHQDLGSNFALKLHALLCRPYVKGRDWYDFNWYVKQKVTPNIQHLQAALFQYGPWQGQPLILGADWLTQTLSAKVLEIDWKQAAQDVERFLSAAEKQSLGLWSERFFQNRIEVLMETLLTAP